MLDQEGGEAFMRAQRRAVNDVDRMVRPILADIFQIGRKGYNLSLGLAGTPLSEKI